MSTMAEELAWHDQAACRGLDTTLFFPTSRNHNRVATEARRICADCPVRAECLEWALRFEQGDWRKRFGIFGGYSARARAQLARCRNGTCDHPGCPEVS